jgi:hypothetical protein
MTGWYEIKSGMRINFNTPFSAVGEVGNLGWLTVLVVWVSIGIILAWMDARCHRLIRKGNRVAAACIVGLAGMFAISALQYNMRNSQRSLIYAAVFILGLQALGAWRTRNTIAGGNDAGHGRKGAPRNAQSPSMGVKSRTELSPGNITFP